MPGIGAMLLVEVTPPGDLVPGQVIELQADAEWLVCEEECIPEQGRVSLTLPALSAARKTVFVVSGEAKGRVVRDIEEGSERSRQYPAARVRCAGSTSWYVAAEDAPVA